MGYAVFTWHVAKDMANRAEHEGMALRDALPLFFNGTLWPQLDLRHIEHRVVAFGLLTGLTYCVVYEFGNNNFGLDVNEVRLISFRRARAKEIKKHAGRHKKK